LAKSRVATSEPFKCTASPLNRQERLEGAIGDALRANFKPVLDEPLPEKLRRLVEKLRVEEQQKEGL
jgi:hypothetical protein